MFLIDLFRPQRPLSAPRRHGVCIDVAEPVELPGVGAVQVRCRVACAGEGCPKPQLLTLKALEECEPGGVVEVITDNLSAVETIPSMMDSYAGEHLATLRDGDIWRIYVRREV